MSVVIAIVSDAFISEAGRGFLAGIQSVRASEAEFFQM